MKIHVHGQNKPIIRGFQKDGRYTEYRTASYRGHMIADTMVEAQKYMQDYLSRGWDINISVEA